MILDDAHASEDFIASLWNVEVNREDHRDIYFALLDLFENVIPSSQLWSLKSNSIPEARTECSKIPSPVAQNREEELRDFLDSALADSDLRHSWRMIRGRLHACHIYVTWPSISIRPITPPTFDHGPFANARQRIYMSATLGEGGELERITGVRRIERLPVPDGWDREGTGRRFIMFPDRILPPDTATQAAITLVLESTRSLILNPSRSASKSVVKKLSGLPQSPAIFSAQQIENSLDPFLSDHHAALILNNRYDGLDLPGDACHLEWIYGLPGATNPQEAFLLNRLRIESLLRDRIRTRLTQALGRCTRNPTDHAVVIISSPRALDFCNKSENRSGFHPELQAEIEYGLKSSEGSWPNDFLDAARAFLRRKLGWEQADQWIRNERDSYPQLEDKVAQTLLDNVQDEIEYANAMWVGDYENALKKARACADRLSGDDLADYRAWWYYLAGSAATLLITKEKLVHLHNVARDLFGRACSASPRSTWFREATRHIDFEITEQPVDDPSLLIACEAIEGRIQQVGVVGAGFEKNTKTMIELLDKTDATSFEQGLEQLGQWLGVHAIRPLGAGVPDGVWSFAGETVVAFEAKSNEQPTGPISLSTAREAQGHIKWIESNMHVTGSSSVSAVVISDRTTISNDALPNTKALFVVSLTSLRELGLKVVSTMRALRAQASGTSNEDFRQVIAERLKDEKLDPKSILGVLQGNPLAELPA